MTPADDHLDLDAVADLEEGLVDEPAATSQREHLESCAQCGEQLARLRTTRALLSALPAEPMPADVAERARAALPDEPPLTTVVPATARRRWTRTPTFAGLGAAAAAVALVAAVVVGATHSSGSKSPESSNAGGAAAGGASRPAGQFPLVTSHRVYTDASAPAAVASLDAAIRGSSASPSPVLTSPQRATDSVSEFNLVTSGRDVPPALRPLYTDRQQLLTCIGKLTAGGPAVEPLAVDFARFTGGQRHVKNAPALVVLLPGTNGDRDGAFIVGPKCATDPSQDLYAFEVVNPTG